MINKQIKNVCSYDSIRNLLSNHTILKLIVTSSLLMLITGVIIYVFPFMSEYQFVIKKTLSIIKSGMQGTKDSQNVTLQEPTVEKLPAQDLIVQQLPVQELVSQELITQEQLEDVPLSTESNPEKPKPFWLKTVIYNTIFIMAVKGSVAITVLAIFYYVPHLDDQTLTNFFNISRRLGLVRPDATNEEFLRICHEARRISFREFVQEIFTEANRNRDRD